MRISIIGAGNVATQLGLGLQKAGITPVQVINRSEQSAQRLAMQLGTAYTTNKQSVLPADLYICCVKDDAIAQAVSDINFGNAILLHSSGSTPMQVLQAFATNYGVFYPMQTFSIDKKVDWSKIPIYIEANNDDSKNKIISFAKCLSPLVHEADSLQREKLHLAAVVACNFTNHLYAIANRLLTRNGLGFDALYPLIDETVAKIKIMSPQQAQTGPAVRGDQKIMNKHLLQLEGIDREIYQLLSKAIQNEKL